MATFVQDTLDNVDTAILGYAENSFATFAGPIAGVLQAMGLVGLALVGFNTLLQWVPVRVSEYVKWGLRYVIVTAVATTWTQFAPIYDIITNSPGALGASLMGIVGAPNLNTAFDAMITTLFDFSDALADESGMFSISLASIIVWIIGGLMAAAAIIVISLGKIGLAMAIALAPIFIPTLMFRATSNLFESWVRFTLGFALIPLVMAGVVGAIVGIGRGLIGEAASATALVDAAGFLIVGVGAIFLTAMVPTLVNGLSGTITATANGVALALGGAGLVGGAAALGGRAVRNTGEAIAPRVTAARQVQAAGTDAAHTGGDPVEARNAERQRQKAMRRKFADLNSQQAAMRGRQASAMDRYRAADAGQRFENRRNRRTDD
ncbi:MAG: type IV secretion system protein [Pseudomonadota bacterium]